MKSARAGEAITDLGSLVAPCAEDELIDCFVRKQRLVIHSSQPRRAEPLLPRWMLERLIASEGLPAARLQVLREGEVIAPQRFRRADGHVRGEGLDALIAEGVSMVVNGIDDDVPAIARLSDALERRLGHRVWVNAYITHGPGGALPPHYDDHDVLVLQVHGHKRWFGHGTPMPSPVDPSPDGEDFGAPRWEVQLEAGDVLYLPRGEVHHTHAEGTYSVHLTLGIETRRGIDFVAAILRETKDETLFREDLTRLGGSAALERKGRQIKDRLHELVERADLGAYLIADDAERSPRPLLHLGNAPVTDTCRIIPAPRRALPSERSEAAATIRTGGVSIELSPLARRVLGLLIERGQAKLREVVAGLAENPDYEEVRAAVNELVRLGLAGLERAKAL